MLQQLWIKPARGWDDPDIPEGIRTSWLVWEAELSGLSEIQVPRWYGSVESGEDIRRELHIFCDASEQAYGAVAYLRISGGNEVLTSFVMARSRVAPKKTISIPRLELCAALSGSQLANLLVKELSVPLHNVTLWSDSTTVLTWICSDSCRCKVFVANRITEILDYTTPEQWRYVNTGNNAADDITRGKRLAELSPTSRWVRGPPFLILPPHQWPKYPSSIPDDMTMELRKPLFCGQTQVFKIPSKLDLSQFNTWSELVAYIIENFSPDSTSENKLSQNQAELLLLRYVQEEDFPEEYELLKFGQNVCTQSRLVELAPEYDPVTGLIRVGGRLRYSEDLEYDTIHPIVLDPKNPITKLLIADFDSTLCHPGPQRVFAQLRRKYWVLRGRQAVKSVQRLCRDCRRWKGSPSVPRMADLPLSRLRLYKPPFWSTGMDCFGPFNVSVGRRHEKRWGLLFKCQTTRYVHLELLSSLDTDHFLLALRCFIARRGQPYELISDQGTNFRGGERELRESFDQLSPALQELLSKQQIRFNFNPPCSPHFGGCWEREVRSIKAALRTTLGTQVLSEEVLYTVLVEVEEMLNSKPLGYVSSNISDPDPITPNILLMGRRDASLPQVLYANSELLSRRKWRHSQVLADRFWSSFIKDYLPSLQGRQKWRQDGNSILCDAVVMVVDPHLPRGLWPIGTVTKILPSPDGRIRVVEVLIEGKYYMRPVSRLVVLDQFSDS